MNDRSRAWRFYGLAFVIDGKEPSSFIDSNMRIVRGVNVFALQ